MQGEKGWTVFTFCALPRVSRLCEAIVCEVLICVLQGEEEKCTVRWGGKKSGVEYVCANSCACISLNATISPLTPTQDRACLPRVGVQLAWKNKV